MDLTTHLQQCRVFSAAQSSIELVPQTSGIYAFYEALDFSRGKLIDEIDSYVTKHGKHVSLKTEQWPFILSLLFRGNPTRFKGEGRALCEKLDAASSSNLQNLLLFLSILSEPLYIGKTDDLRVRFRAHHDNGFLFRMKEEFKRSPNEFVYFAYLAAQEQVRLIESILIQTVNPPFCEQKS